MRRFAWLVAACLVLGPLIGGPTGLLRGRAQGGESLELLATIKVGGRPSAIVVDCCAGRNDVIFYDSDRVRFIDGDTLTVAPEQIALPTYEWEGWMAYDRSHHQAYVVTTQLHQSSLYPSWKEVEVHVVAGRSLLDSFSVNAGYNTDPSDPIDTQYLVAGLALKQSSSEGGNPGRLFLDNTSLGNIDVVDLNEDGTAAARLQRASYRGAVSGASELIRGNSLALETQHETLPTDDLTSTDMLYISDKNHASDYGLRALRLGHPLQDLNAAPLPDIDLQFRCGAGGCQGIAMAGPRDVLYVASGDQTFDNGYVDEVDTTDNQLAQALDLTYGDLGFFAVDPDDARRIFVPTFDGWYNDPHQGLYLHLLYDSAVVDTLRLMDGYDEYEGLRGMAYDPQNRRLYLTVASSVLVVQVKDDSGPPPTCPRPLNSVAINGPTNGGIGTPYTFSAVVSPSDATIPITYAWSPEPVSGTGTAGAVYQWSAPGSYTVAVTAQNCGGTHTAQHTITIDAGTRYRYYLPLVRSV